MSIAENVKNILDKIKPGVTVIGVTKTVGADLVLEMVRAGIADVGENRVQELKHKRLAVSEAADSENLPITWHMIGHLQSNKVKQAVAVADIIHSVDSMKLVRLIDKEAGALNKRMDVLVEVNIALEDSKIGVHPAEVLDFAKEVRALPNINLRGLMCVAPITDDPEDNRFYFRKMREMKDALGVDMLSMGMTQDFEVAMEEGSTMVRIGTAIFGERG